MGDLGDGAHSLTERRWNFSMSLTILLRKETERVGELEREIAMLKQDRDRKDRKPILRTGYVLISECQRVLRRRLEKYNPVFSYKKRENYLTKRQIADVTLEKKTLTLPLVSVDPDCELHSNVCVLQMDTDTLPTGAFQEHHLENSRYAPTLQ